MVSRINALNPVGAGAVCGGTADTAQTVAKKVARILLNMGGKETPAAADEKGKSRKNGCGFQRGGCVGAEWVNCTATKTPQARRRKVC
jgi:hypothetical protein